MIQNKTIYTLLTLLFMQGLLLFTPNTSFSQWDSERVTRPSPRVALGVRTGYDWDADTWSLGGQVNVPLGLGRGGIQIIPSGDVFFIQGGTDWQLNLDVAIRLLIFYGGVGLSYLNRDFSKPDEKAEKTGINYFVGLPLPIRKLPFRIFIEARWTDVLDEQLFRFVAGVNFSLGRSR